MDRVLGNYYPAAKAFGWPPSVVNRESALIMHGLITIHEVVSQMESEHQADQNNAAMGRGVRNGSMAG